LARAVATNSSIVLDGDSLHQHGHGVAMVAAQAALELARHDHRRGTCHDVRVTLLVDQVAVADGAAAADAVVHVERHRRPFVLVHDPGDHAHQVVGAAARGVGHDHLDVLRRVFRLGERLARRREQQHDPCCGGGHEFQ